MAKKIVSLLTTTILFAGMIIIQAPLMAQEQQTVQEITVTAPRITREDRNLPYGKTIVAEKSATVNVADLDLSKSADMLELENRVEKAAEKICSDLTDELPLGQPSTPVCVARAVADTMAQVKDAMRQ